MKKLLLCTFFAFLFFSLVAQAQEFSITIDGEKDAFYSTLTGPDDGYIFMPYESFTTDLGTQPSSNDDVSGFVWFAWDEDFLYCYLEVTDDTMMVIDQDRWYNDGIEIKFDPDPSAGTGSGTSNLRLTALGYGDADSNGVDNLNRSGHLEDASGNDLVVAESDFARRVTSDGYALEFRVPFDYINEMEDDRYMVSREEGNVFGMAINIIDNDSGSRDHMLQWSAGVVDAAHSDAAYHGSVTFLSGNKLKLDASVSPRTDTVSNANANWYYPPSQEFSISIDAEKDAFYSTLTGPDDGYIFMPYESFTTDLGTQPSSNDDVSGFFWFAWDEDFLYCYLEVTDDTMNVTNTSRWYNDGIEIKFDPDPSAGTGSGTSNLRLTALDYDDVEDSSCVDNLNRSGHLEDASGNDLVVAESDYARRLTSDGYALEFRVPFDYINEMEDDRYMVSREEGNVFGMAINLIDNDSGSRDHMLQWSAGVVDAAHSDAAYHGSVTFLSGNKLKLDASVSPRTDTVSNANAADWYDPANVTAVTFDPETEITESFYLSPNYPNPFNPSTTIEFSIPKATHVSLRIYNSIGQEVAQLVSEQLNPGVYTTTWNAAGFSSGIYYYQIRAGEFIQTRKLVLLK